jgi:hypothetical protein
MKLTRTGYRISKNGSVIDSIEKEAITLDCYRSYVLAGKSIKRDGIYYFFNRKQGNTYIYLP